MNIRVHFPETEEGMKELSDRVAKAHAQSVITHLSKLQISDKEKMTLLAAGLKKCS